MATITVGLVDAEFRGSTLSDSELNKTGLIDPEMASVTTGAAATVVFRRTLSSLGTRVGSRQVQGQG